MQWYLLCSTVLSSLHSFIVFGTFIPYLFIYQFLTACAMIPLYVVRFYLVFSPLSSFEHLYFICLYTNWFALHKPYRQSRHPPLPLLDAKQPCCETPGVISVIVLSCALNYTLIDVNISVILTNRNVTASSSTDPWCCLYSDMDVMSPCFFYKYYSVSQSPLHLKTFASTTRLVYRVVPPNF